MTPEELSKLHPRLYHVTSPRAWALISKIGLLPATDLVQKFETDIARRQQLTTIRRSREAMLAEPTLGTATLSDNAPLSERKLASCLDDGLTPSDWMKMLNERVFFWVDTRRVDKLLNAGTNKARSRDVLVFDTLSLTRSHANNVQISPINSGATIRRPARRGLMTFTPMLEKSYADWQQQRGKRDRIVEVVVHGAVLDVTQHLLERRNSHSGEHQPLSV